MAQFVKNYVQDLAQDIQIRHCGTLIFNTDTDSNVINVALYNGQEEAPQSGSVACAVICSDGSTVPVTGGTISGNTVSVTLGADGLIPGQVGIGIQVISGDVKTTVFKAVYSVELFETDTVVDPSSRITISVGELVSDIEAAVASIPADYSDLLAAIAPTFSTSTAYASGSYVWYSGHLYRFTAAHSAGAWIGTDAVQVALADDVSDLKSALSAESDAILAQINSIHNYINYGYDNEGQISDNDMVFLRRKTSLIVNGSTSSTTRLKISGDLAIALNASSTIAWNTGIQLEEGKTYKFSYQFLSGNVTFPDGGALPVLSVYPVGKSTSIGTTERVGNTYTRTFTAPAGEVNLAFYVAANTTFVNAEYVLLLEKISEPGPEITPYINPLSVGLYGDSICKGTITSGVYATKNFAEYIADELGYSATNNAVGGSGYCKRSDMESLSDAVIANGVNFGAILLFAGTNDYGYNKSIGTIDDVPSNTTSSTFYAAVKYLIEYIYANNQNCQVMIVTPTFRNYHASGGFGNTYTTIQNTAGFTLGDFCDALVAIGKYYNIPVFDMRENSVVNFLNYAEKLTETGASTGKYLHPTDAAYPSIYKKLVKWIHTII